MNALLRCFRSPSFLLATAVVALSVSGCGDQLRQPTYEASGEIRLNGRPLPNATIVLHAVDKSQFKWAELPQATTNDEGKFSLHTYDSNDGAPAGEYKVGIAVFGRTVEIGDDQVVHDKNERLLPTKYNSPDTSGLTMTIAPTKNELPPLELSTR